MPGTLSDWFPSTAGIGEVREFVDGKCQIRGNSVCIGCCSVTTTMQSKPFLKTTCKRVFGHFFASLSHQAGECRQCCKLARTKQFSPSRNPISRYTEAKRLFKKLAVWFPFGVGRFCFFS